MPKYKLILERTIHEMAEIEVDLPITLPEAPARDGKT